MNDKEFVVAFRKMIAFTAPAANTKMTGENVPAVLLADWGRRACDLLEARQPDTGLVEALRLLTMALPHIECKDASDCNMITFIGEFLDKYKGVMEREAK